MEFRWGKVEAITGQPSGNSVYGELEDFVDTVGFVRFEMITKVVDKKDRLLHRKIFHLRYKSHGLRFTSLNQLTRRRVGIFFEGEGGGGGGMSDGKITIA